MRSQLLVGCDIAAAAWPRGKYRDHSACLMSSQTTVRALTFLAEQSEQAVEYSFTCVVSCL